MYTQQSLHDLIFVMLYGGVAMMAFLASIYLWFRRSNAIAPDVMPSTPLRCWTAAFFIVAGLSHIWWYALGVHWLTDDRLVRNITAVTLDHVALLPLVMAMLLRMLQDRQRRLWPWALAQVPILLIAAEGIISHNPDCMDIMHYWQVAVIGSFIAYYVYALFQYGRWLRENYADLEHKEVWQSLLFVVILFVVYEVYSTNPGVMSREYLAQFNTIAIILFLLWRVETLQQLEVKEEEEQQEPVMEAAESGKQEAAFIPSNIGSMLQKHCEKPHLYLQHDLTLSQLAEKIGTNRTYLGQYFTQQGITYNAYINGLRVAHFERLYEVAVTTMRPFTAQQLANESGFRSYSTFSSAFKQIKGQTVSEWIRQQGK